MSRNKAAMYTTTHLSSFIRVAALLFFSLLAVNLLLTGCRPSQTAKPSTQEIRINQLLLSSAALEKQGNLVEARQQCRRALELDPGHAEATACKKRLDRTLNQLAGQKVRQGISLAKRGKKTAAHQSFLEALRLEPLHEQALRQIARNHPPTKTPFISVKLKPGGSLSKLALKYYGNSRYYPLISGFNRIKHDSKVKAGQRLRIPKIKGLPLETHGAVLRTMKPVEKKATAYREKGSAQIKAGKHKQAIATLKKALKTDRDDLATRQLLAAAYHHLGQRQFEKKAYTKALESFNTSLKVDPNCKPCRENLDRYNRTIAQLHIKEGRRMFKAGQHEDAVAEFNIARQLAEEDLKRDSIISRAYFLEAKRLYSRNDFLTARDHYETAARFSPKRLKYEKYKRECIDTYLRVHYDRGNDFYQKNQIDFAIIEWQKVSAIDPNYKAVRYNLELTQILKNPAEE